MDTELNDKIKEIGSLFGINELPDNIGDIIGTFINNTSGNETQLDKTKYEQNVNNDESGINTVCDQLININNNTTTENDFPDIDISQIISLINKYQKIKTENKNDKKIQLLRAIKPFLSEKRKNKVKNCITILTIAKMVDLQ